MKRALLTVLLLFVPMLVRAEPTEATEARAITLSEALRMAREQSPRILAETARIREAEATTRSAKVLPNPTFAYMGNYLTSGVNTGAQLFHQLTLDQPIPLWGKRSARVNAAKRGAEATRLGVAASVVELLGETRRAFFALLASQERLVLLQRFRQDLAQVQTIVEGRQRGGVASNYDVLRIQIEGKALAAQISGAEADVTEARGRLALVLAQPHVTFRAEGSIELEDVPLDFDTLWERQGQLQPSLAAGKAQARAAEAEVAAAKRQAIPSPNLQAGAVITQNQNSTMAYAGISFPLPLFDHGQGTVGVAEARAERTRLEARALEQERRVALEQALSVLHDRRQAFADYERDVRNQVTELRRLTDSAYAGSQITILELLDALRTERDLRLGELVLAEQAKAAEVEVRIAAGHAE